MNIKVNVQELIIKYGHGDEPNTEEWKDIFLLYSKDPKVIAGSLRALAKEFDPPKDSRY